MPATVTIYNNALKEMAQGTIRFDGNTAMKLLLVQPSSQYTPSKTHVYRSPDFTGTEVLAGNGYTAGGATVTLTSSSVTISGSNTIDIAFPTTSWSSSSISAKAALLYANIGTAATDKLIAYIDFGQTITSSNSTFTVTFSTALKLQNS